MKRVFAFCVLGVVLAGCSYHHKLPRDIFAAPSAEQRIKARVVVASDKVAQKQFVFKDYHANNSVHSYKIDLAEGSLIATANSLATLFTSVEVNPSKKVDTYDYLAQLTYTVGGTQTDSLDSVQWLTGKPPILETRVMVEIYNTHTQQKVFSMFASRQNRVEMTDASAAAQRVEDKGTTLFLPITGPVYTQQFGNDLRYTLSRDLSECLMEIAQTLQQNRRLFEQRP